MQVSYEKAYALHGIKLTCDFKLFNSFSLEKLIASLQFTPYSTLDGENVYNYSSPLFQFSYSTYLLMNQFDRIYKVRYLDCNFKKLIESLSPARQFAY